MKIEKQSPRLCHPRVVGGAALGVLALLATGCATLPRSEVGPAPQSITAYASAAIAGEQGEWPSDKWWEGYGDAQLSALIEEALASAPDMRAAEARTKLARAYVTDSRAALLPTVTGGASVQANHYSYNLGVPLPQGWQDNGRAALDFAWEIDFWGKNRAALAAATSDAKAAMAERAAAAIGLSTALASEYANLAGLYADLDAVNEAVSVRHKTLTLMREREGQGLENRSAVERARSAHSNALAEKIAVAEAITLTKNRMAVLMGAGPDRGEAIERPAVKIGPKPLPANLPAELMGRRADVVASRLRVEAAAKRIKVAEKSFYPNVNLAAVVGLQSMTLDRLFREDSFTGTGGPAISLPFFQGGRLRANYRASEAQYDLSVASYEAAVSQALGDVANVTASQRALAERLGHVREAHVAANAAWTVANNRYRGGLATYLEVLTAEDALIAAHRQLSALETRAFTLDVALVRALGGGYRAA